MIARIWHDLQGPVARRRNGASRLLAGVAGIGVDALDEGKSAACPLEDRANGIAVLNVGGEHSDAQQQTERVDEDVPLAARDFLRRIVAWRLQRPPFCAALAL